MNKIQLPEFKTYGEEAAFWDNLDTADMMEDDGEWFHFGVTDARTVGVEGEALTSHLFGLTLEVRQ